MAERDGGLLRDDHGRPILKHVAANAPKAVSDILMAGTLVDTDGKEIVTIEGIAASSDISATNARVTTLETDVAVIKEAPLNIDHAAYGGSLQAGINALPTSGGAIIVPNAIRTVSTPITLTKNYVTIRGEGRGSELRTSTGDLFHVGAANVRPVGLHMEGLYLRSLAGGGHVFASQGSGLEGQGGLEQAVFKGVRMDQDNAAKSIYHTNNQGMVIGCHWDEHCYLSHVDGATVSAFNLVTAWGEINGNTWDRCWCYYSGEHFFRLENTSASTYVYGNKIIGVVAEIMRGGLVKILSGFGNIIEDVINWDMAALGASTRDWILVGKSAAGPLSRYTKIRGGGRANGSLGAGLYDVKLRSGEAQFSRIDVDDAATLAGYSIDLGPNYGTHLLTTTAAVIANMSSSTSGTLTGRGDEPEYTPAVVVGGKKIIMQTAAPATGTWAVGDRCLKSNPAAGQPKGWICTVAGTPGTWVSEGNL